ncbi:MAG: S46 family peptidase [Bacteroidales bacterium]|nr:S46 family peptidase [Bacteroidales bacterium]
MKKSTYLLATLIFFSSLSLKAHEGMWIPMLLKQNFAAMQKMGLNLTPEQIYSINHGSMKDAIAGLSNSPNPQGFFCTSEIVSDQGLLFTNHHCGYESIQKHSTVKNDYLKDGFWAMSQKEELPNMGLTASVLVRMADVTDSIVPQLGNKEGRDRSAAASEIIARLKKENSENGKYNVVIKPFFEGNKYFMMVYIVYKDVRLVGAPPSAIGKFGGDTDNWMWPRHTGDFSIFRIYTAPDGSPATYSKDNVPLKPKYHLPISLDGVKPGDFAMTWGFPGSTTRYMTAPELKFRMADYMPPLITAFGKKLEIWKKHMDANQDVRIKYSSEYAMIANSWKYFVGQTKGVRDLGVIKEKEAFDQKFNQWADANADRKAEFGSVISNLTKDYEKASQGIEPLIYASVTGVSGAQIIGFARQFSGIENLLQQVDKATGKEEKATKEKLVNQSAKELSESLSKVYKDYDEATDQDVFAALTQMYVEKTPANLHPDYLNKLVEKFKSDYSKMAEYVFSKSIFANKQKAEAFLQKPDLKKLKKDPAYQLMTGYMEKMMGAQTAYMGATSKLSTQKRLFMKGIMEMDPNKAWYPDANSTLRFSYGKVEGYYPRDAVHYLFQTHLWGAMQKGQEYPDNPEFTIPKKLKELYNEKDYGQYGVNDTLDVCFLTTNDITGGNSGSPVINGNGQLIGLAFDGNWEAMSSDIQYIPKLQRTIVVDIRYVLFVIDKYAGDHRLIDELTLVKTPAMAEESRIRDLSPIAAAY